MEMEMEFLRKLPTPQELKEQFPVSTEVVAVKAQRDEEIRNIFEGKDDRLILVIGPCSADNEDAAGLPRNVHLLPHKTTDQTNICDSPGRAFHLHR